MNPATLRAAAAEIRAHGGARLQMTADVLEAVAVEVDRGGDPVDAWFAILPPSGPAAKPPTHVPAAHWRLELLLRHVHSSLATHQPTSPAQAREGEAMTAPLTAARLVDQMVDRAKATEHLRVVMEWIDTPDQDYGWVVGDTYTELEASLRREWALVTALVLAAREVCASHSRHLGRPCACDLCEPYREIAAVKLEGEP